MTPNHRTAGTVHLIGLELAGLIVHASGADTPILNGVRFRVPPGGRLGIVGRSGAGKSTIATAIAGFLPKSFRVSGHASIIGDDELRVDLGSPEDPGRSQLRATTAMIPQDSIGALNPYRKIGRQLMDTIRLHDPTIPRRSAAAAATDWVQRVGLPRTREILGAYPHQLSGGMRQRITVALSLCGGQRLIIADEPTAALDTVQQSISLGLLDALCRSQGRSLIYISHNIALVAKLCDQIVVIEGGAIVEEGRTLDVLREPAHAITAQLISEAHRLALPSSGRQE